MIEVNAFTHCGRVRPANEDGITVAGWVSDVAMSGPRRSRHELTGPLLIALADGMGGHAAGEVASRYTVKRLAALSLANGEADVGAALADVNVDLTWLSWTKLCDKMSLERSLAMPKKRFSAEHIVTLLRQIEVTMS